jgi:pimeloyl-ACP methyl ester carboxylesterase
MPYARVNKINLYYEVHGEGEPLVLNGGGGSSIEAQASRIAAFSPEYQVIAYEARGAGRSDAPDIPYTEEMLSGDIAGIMDTVGVDSAHVFGISNGSGLAMIFALHYPERVKSLILASSATSGSPRIPSSELVDFQRKVPGMTPEERAEAQVRLFFTGKYIDDNPEIVAGVKKAMQSAAAAGQGNLRMMQWSMAVDAYDRLPEMKIPTLVIHGEADIPIPVENARILAARLPDSELVIFPDTGHMLSEAGDDLYKTILDFMNRHSGK